MAKIYNVHGEAVSVQDIARMLFGPCDGDAFSKKQMALAEVVLEYFQEAYYDDDVPTGFITQADVDNIDVYGFDDLVSEFSDDAIAAGFTKNQLDNPTPEDKQKLWKFFDELLDSRSPWHDPERMVIITDI